MPAIPVYSKGCIPPVPGGWNLYRKKRLTAATRIEGPFTVDTREGTVHCPDGFLALDANGYPYPIARDEFEAIYEKAE